MRSIREFYETKMTFTSTRDENVIGPLRDTADSILEQLQNEECSLAHHVRALSILLWLVEILEKIGISLDRQTRDEVEGCAKALTGEYLRRGRYNVVDVLWALEWASKRTIEEMAPQVPDSSSRTFRTATFVFHDVATRLGPKYII
jgi:dsDNA-binding SOS-regulon protein